MGDEPIAALDGRGEHTVRGHAMVQAEQTADAPGCTCGNVQEVISLDKGREMLD
jgi:hypothetical protein